MGKAFILLVILAISGLFVFSRFNKTTQLNTPSSPASGQKETEAMRIVAQNLEVPWALAFLPDGNLLVTERKGTVRVIDSNGNLDPTPVATIANVKEIGEGGLLGITIDPDFETNHYVYLYYTYSSSGNNTLNRVVRMVYTDKKLTDDKIIIDNIPGASNHNGGRIKFGPDGNLYITTGDAENPSQAQNPQALGGKILQVTNDGKTQMYSYGHRNPQGIAWDASGNLWETEHGKSGLQSGLDEINRIEVGKNYGWPEIQGDQNRNGMITPKHNSGTSTTWAPSGATFVDNSLFFAGLRGETLYEAVIQNNEVVEIKEHLKGQYGRLREVILGPDNMLYITTSNRDGRGSPAIDDDKIIRIDLKKL